MNAHTWYRSHGEAINRDASRGSFTHTMEKVSIGLIWTSVGLNLRFFSAVMAGSLTISHSLFANTMQRMNEMPRPMSARMMRERNSSMYSMKDIRSIPSSSSSSSAGGGAAVALTI